MKEASCRGGRASSQVAIVDKELANWEACYCEFFEKGVTVVRQGQNPRWPCGSQWFDRGRKRHKWRRESIKKYRSKWWRITVKEGGADAVAIGNSKGKMLRIRFYFFTVRTPFPISPSLMLTPQKSSGKKLCVRIYFPWQWPFRFV